MSFFFKTPSSPPPGNAVLEPQPEAMIEKEELHHELISQRPALLDEKVKLHARIIDEFNLATLEKLPRDELIREVRSYLSDYAREEHLTLNQRELQAFAEEVVDEMVGYGPIEPL